MVEMGFAWKVRISLWYIVASLKGLEILGMEFLVIGIENCEFKLSNDVGSLSCKT